MWGHAHNLGVAKSFAGRAIALGREVDSADYFAHVGSDDDVGILGVVLDSLLPARVLPLST